MKNIWKRNALLVCFGTLVACNAVSTAQAQNLVLGQGGKTNYVIYHEANAPDSVRAAALELQGYFAKAAGFKPQLQTPEAAPNVPFISLGNTVAARAAKVDATKIPADGFRILVRGGNIFIIGQDTPKGAVTSQGGVSNGTANGVYSFCEDYLGVRWLLPGDLGEEILRKNEVAIPANLDRIEVPLFDYRRLPYIGETTASNKWAQRMRVAKNEQVARVEHGHNWDTISPTLFDKHPDWFAEVGGKRLPPTGRYKLETTNPELVQAFAAEVIAAFDKDPNLKWFSLSPSDGGGWSETALAKALYDKDPRGRNSVTPLVLKFYNDVAKIVAQKYPDRKLGGYIYADYLYPPSGGIPKMEPNLALTVAASISYGYQLHRPAVQTEWENLVRAWGEAAKAGGAEIYYYDLPTYFKQSLGVITPPAPEILNFVFSRLAKYGYKGGYIYGVEGWPQSGPMNYALAKLLWNPKLDAVELCREYYRAAYGVEAAPHIEALYNLLDNSFRDYYNRHPAASYNLTPTFHSEIYGPNYRQIEAHFLKAREAAKEPKQQSRLRLFGQILSLLQWNLKANRALPGDYQSALTLSDDEIDKLFQQPGKDFSITALATEMKPDAFRWQASLSNQLPDGEVPTSVVIPTRSDVRMLLHAPRTGEISVVSKALESQGEFVRYTLMDAATNEVIRAGALRAGRVLTFPAQAGKTYRLDVANTWSSLRLEARGAVVAYRTNVLHRGFRVEAHALAQEKTPLAFYVPADVKNFNITINGGGVVASVVSPEGKSVGTIDTRATPIARLAVPETDHREGYWQLVLERPVAGAEERNIYIVLDEKLPQWFFSDVVRPLKITQQP